MAEYEVVFEDGIPLRVHGRPVVSQNGDLIIMGPDVPVYIFARGYWKYVRVEQT